MFDWSRSFRSSARDRAASIARVRQLEYQRRKAIRLMGNEQATLAACARHAQNIRARIENLTTIGTSTRVLDVGCGAHGIIFFLDHPRGVGIDPLAREYSDLFPLWQKRAMTMAGAGEALPFRDASFEMVLCDNVIDHAELPEAILRELVRVLAPGGVLYFSVNVHHRLYRALGVLHEAWNAIGVPIELSPFAAHTVHFTLSEVKDLVASLPLKVSWSSDGIQAARDGARRLRPRHLGDRLKRVFFKNARFEAIATRC